MTGQRTVVHGGEVVGTDGPRLVDVELSGSTITNVGPDLGRRGAATIDAAGCLIFPGGVDVHTHFDFPLGSVRTVDDFASGSGAALHGGTTTVVNYCTMTPGTTTVDAIDEWMTRAAPSTVDYGFHLVLTEAPPTLGKELQLAVDRGVTSFKVYMAYPGEFMIDDGALFTVLDTCRQVGALCCVHAENGAVIDVMTRSAVAAGRTGARWHAATRPPATESEAVHRAIQVAALADAALYIVHVSSAGAAAEIASARSAGQRVYAETCPHYLALDDSVYVASDEVALRYVLSPPIRGRSDQDALWQALQTDALSVVSSDHCPTCLTDRRRLGGDDFRRIPNGAGSIEHRLTLLYTYGVLAGHIDLGRLVALFSEQPARLFGLYPRKGTVAVGSDADLVIFDPTGTATLAAATDHSQADYSMFEGIDVTGVVRTVIRRGAAVIDDRVQTTTGGGEYLVRDVSGAL